MEKAIVRESKFRHLHGRPWRKEVCVSNVKVSKAACFIRASDKYFGVPWETVGGAINVVPLGYAGKLKDSSKLVRAHQSPIQDFAFSPFRASFMVTASRESVIKGWEIPEGGSMTAAADITTPVVELKGHKSKVDLVAFHPSVEVLASVAGDNEIKLWDLTAAAEAVSLPGWKGQAIQSMSWNDTGKLIATSCKDRKLRIYDPRAGPAPTHEAETHEGSKGFYATFLENDRVLTIGFAKASNFQISIWDPRAGNLSTSFATRTFEPSSTILYPHYDDGVLYVSGRGDKFMMYEINNTEPYIHPVAQVKCASYHTAIVLPKRMVNVRECELARFMTVGENYIETVSMYAPRKSASTVFQEDLYSPVPSGVPATTTSAEWLAGAEAPVTYMNLQPEGMVSIFDIAPEEGGKDFELEYERKRSATASQRDLDSFVPESVKALPVPELQSGTLEHFLGGWSAPWAGRWASVEETELAFYKDEDSAKLLFSIPFAAVAKTSVDEKLEGQFLVKLDATQKSKEYRFKVDSAESAGKWVRTIEACKQLVAEIGTTRAPSAQPPATKSLRSSGSAIGSPARSPGVSRLRGSAGASMSSSSGSSSSLSPTASPTASPARIDIEPTEGFLDTLMPGNVYSGTMTWSRRWYNLDPKTRTLLAYPTNRKLHSHPIDKFSLAKVIAIAKSEGVDPKQKKFTLKLCTAGQVLHLAADTEEDRDRWLEALLQSSPLEHGSGTDGASSFVAAPATEGYVNLKRSAAANWERVWMSCAGQTLLYYKTNMAQKATDKLTVKDVRLVEAVSPTEFRIELVTDPAGSGWLHRANGGEDRDRWMTRLDFMRKQTVDVFDFLRIQDSEVESAVSEERIEANFIDPVEVKNGNRPLLIQIKGRRRIRVAQVALTTASLTTRSSFVLDAGRAIYIWNGEQAPRVTRAKAADLANLIRMKERGGLSQVFVLDQGKTDDNPAFWRPLGGKVNIADSAPEEEGQLYIRLYRVLDRDTPKQNRIKLVHDGTQLPPREFLDTRSTTVVDAETEIFVWVGRGATVYQRKLAMLVAKKLSTEPHRPSWTSITRIPEEAETILFKEKFSNYPGMLPINVARQEAKGKIAAAQVQEDIDVKKLLRYAPPAPTMFDDGKGQIAKIWRIEDFNKVDVPEEQYGSFYCCDSYVLLYNYRAEESGKESHIVYFWQGIESSRTEKGTSAFMTVDVTTELGDGDHHRVVQDAEPAHFLQILKDRFVVYKGKHTDRSGNGHNGLFLLAGESELNVRPTEVTKAAASLNSFHSFVLAGASSVYVWHGRLANAFERAAATALAARFKDARSVTEVAEGSEPAGFWSELGGKGGYYGAPDYPVSLSRRAPRRLFLCSNATGSVKVSEVFDFTQEDLPTNHCAIVDGVNEIYVWFGTSATDLEKQMAMETAVDYAKESPDHPPDTPVWVVSEGTETLGFTSHFRSWLPSKKAGTSAPVALPVDEVLQRYTTETYTLEQLLQDTLPPGVNPTRLETYLSDAEFEQVFKMTRKEFMKIPLWKAEQLKAEARLF